MNETATTESKPPVKTCMAALAPLKDPLKFIVNACHSHTAAIINDRWCRHDLSLRFTVTGMQRACQIFGWIAGIAAHADDAYQTFAASAAKNICDQFDWLAIYGGQIVDTVPSRSRDGGTYDIHNPRYIVELTDDGTLHGFGVLWLVIVHPDQQKELEDDDQSFHEVWTDRYTDGPRYKWAYSRKHGSWNGGLLYHGPGHGQVFAVQFGTTSLWAIHT